MSDDVLRLETREIGSGPGDKDLLGSVYEGLYSRAFPRADERELLENIWHYLELKASGWYGPNNYHFIVLLDGGVPVAASISDYLAEPNGGVIEFLVVEESRRREGLGRRMLRATEAALDADALRRGGPPLDWVAGEMDDPFRSPPEASGVMDPFERPLVWSSWGYRRLRFPYVQPALAAHLDPVEELLLMARVVHARWTSGVPSDRVASLLREYMRWAMRIDAPEANGQYVAMERCLARLPEVPLASLAAYVGRAPDRCVFEREVTGIDDTDVGGVLSQYVGQFRNAATTVSPEVFARSLACGAPCSDFDYHLWSFRASADGPIAGMASFFTFPAVGFGGYLTLGPGLRGRGLLREALTLVERRMVVDRRGAEGWLIECEPGEAAAGMFRRLGFREVDIEYRQPPLPGAGEPLDSPRLHLLYKGFGDSCRAPAISVERFLEGLAQVFRVVYEIEQPEASPWHRAVADRLAARGSASVPWRGP